jgi:hypothetical protein
VISTSEVLEEVVACEIAWDERPLFSSVGLNLRCSSPDVPSDHRAVTEPLGQPEGTSRQSRSSIETPSLISLSPGMEEVNSDQELDDEGYATESEAIVTSGARAEAGPLTDVSVNAAERSSYVVSSWEEDIKRPSVKADAEIDHAVDRLLGKLGIGSSPLLRPDRNQEMPADNSLNLEYPATRGPMPCGSSPMFGAASSLNLPTSTKDDIEDATFEELDGLCSIGGEKVEELDGTCVIEDVTFEELHSPVFIEDQIPLSDPESQLLLSVEDAIRRLTRPKSNTSVHTKPRPRASPSLRRTAYLCSTG